MLITLPVSELTPGMYVDSVTKQHEGINSIKIKTSGLVRDKSIIKRLVSEGVLELLIDFTKGDAPVPAKYKPQSAPKTSNSQKKVEKTPIAISIEQEFAKATVNYDQHYERLS